MSRRLLLVDDDPNIRDGLLDILEDAGYHAASVGTGAQALQHLEKSPAELILLDYRLPDGTALEWAPRLRAACAGVKIFLLTGMASQDLPSPLEGIDQCLAKPVAPADLLSSIARALT